MAGRSIPKAAVAVMMISLLGTLLILSIPSIAVGPYGVVEIEEDTVHIGVSPDDTGTVDIEASIRSTETKNTVFNIQWELDGPTNWAVEIPEKIYLGPLEKKSFTVTVICPIGERADTSAVLEISAVPEGMEIAWDGEISSDSIDIKIDPYYGASIILENDFELDVPTSSPIEIRIQNDGNIRAPINIQIKNVSMRTGPRMSMVDPGDNTTVDLYLEDLIENDELTIEIFTKAGDWTSEEGIVFEIVRDRSLFHILFKPGPILILTDFDPIADDLPRMDLFCLGGDVSNVGLEIVNGPYGATLKTEGGGQLENLGRAHLTYEINGVTESQIVLIRGYGYHDGKRVVSNPIPIWVKGVKVETASLPVPALVGGGAAAATLVLTGTAAYFYSASEVFKYRWLTLALVPLYSIVHDEKVLDHFFRGRLFEYVKENPGVTFTALKEHFEVNNGTLTYHLHKLEREDLICFRNLGKYKMFYADGVRIKGVEVVISPMDKEIVEIISADPGVASSQIIAMLRGQRSPRTISRHLKQLERKGFIQVERSHGSRRLFISGDLERVLMPHTGVVEVAEMTAV